MKSPGPPHLRLVDRPVAAPDRPAPAVVHEAPGPDQHEEWTWEQAVLALRRVYESPERPGWVHVSIAIGVAEKHIAESAAERRRRLRPLNGGQSAPAALPEHAGR